MLVTLDWLHENYDKYNREYWGGELPDVELKINNTHHRWGYASYNYNLRTGTVTPMAITLSNYFDSPEKVKLTTLLHEMIHIADYTLHPEHYIKPNCFGYYYRVKNYDAHGWEFFMREAERLKQYGWDINKYVTEEEKNESELSLPNRESVEKKMEKGINFFILKYDKPYVHEKTNSTYEFGYCKAGTIRSKILNNIYRNAKKYRFVDEYISHSQEAVLMKTKSAGVFFLTNEPEKIIEEFKLEYSGRVVGDMENEPINGVKPEKKETLPTSDTQTSIDFGNGGEKRIPIFQMTFKNGRKFTLKNVTEDELLKSLKDTFPAWSDDVIRKIIDNEKFYPEGK